MFVVEILFFYTQNSLIPNLFSNTFFNQNQTFVMLKKSIKKICA